MFYEVFDGDDEEKASKATNDAKSKAVRRFGSFFTPQAAAPSREGEGGNEEARIVLMADAGTGDASPSTQSRGWIFVATRNTSAAVAANLESAPDEAEKAKSPKEAKAAAKENNSLSGFRGRLLVHAGDISYANGHGSIWDAFFEQWRPALERARYAAVVGNHGKVLVFFSKLFFSFFFHSPYSHFLACLLACFLSSFISS